ncbi:hypothetical protein [Chitinimonas sp. BJB300]|uniref:hypothetical protein n=1 Tax=Chitinimonas sp. BJB300 TaxID=1559339 RepID=UPI000C0C8530|nr:hypothetical protein [Chitinimonas sp. BJB300]PHV12179.1 hypothetical protein CSQ89_06930 [Chitinimonas sp. BJB300]TSJ91584.1 hypothetical protein FG002_004775 [Chitinimonas sp. BJB300]
MDWIGKAAYAIGAILFVVFLKKGQFGLAFGIICVGVIAGVFAVWRYIQAAREREEEQWKADVTIPMKLRRPKDGTANKQSK